MVHQHSGHALRHAMPYHKLFEGKRRGARRITWWFWLVLCPLQRMFWTLCTPSFLFLLELPHHACHSPHYHHPWVSVYSASSHLPTTTTYHHYVGTIARYGYPPHTHSLQVEVNMGGQAGATVYTGQASRSQVWRAFPTHPHRACAVLMVASCRRMNQVNYTMVPNARSDLCF